MVREVLKIYIDDGAEELKTFHDIELTDYTYSEPRMGTPTLTATLKWNTCLDKEWTKKEYVELRGERYYIRDIPTSAKSNTDARYEHKLTFRSERDDLLGGLLFRDVVPSHALTADRPCSNSTTVKFYGTIREYIDRLNCAFLEAGVGDSILKTKTDLTTSDAVVGDGYCAMRPATYDTDKSIEYSFEDKYLWEVISEGYKLNEVPFMFRGKKIIFGDESVLVDHTFKYGHDNELLKITKTNANAKVINRITMVGSSENIPYYYPNETEYGHIKLVASKDNKTLQSDGLDIANSRQLLANIPSGEKATFIFHQSSAGTGTVNMLDMKVGVDREESMLYIPGEAKKIIIHENNGTAQVNVGIRFMISGTDEYCCKEIPVSIWSPNTARPANGANIIPNINTSKSLLATNENDVIQANLSNQISVENGVVNFGELLYSGYRYTFNFSFTVTGLDKTKASEWFIVIGNPTLSAGSQRAGYYWKVGNKKYSVIGELGVKLNEGAAVSVGDSFGWEVESDSRMNFQSALVPPKYRSTMGAERFYNALNNTYINPDTGKYYEFKNLYDPKAPSEYIYRNEDIKPTITGIRNSAGKLFGEIAGVAFDSDDNDSLKPDSTGDSDKNDALKYEHSFFYLKLNKFDGEYGFNLFEQASQTEAMIIQMTSGPCNGCKFKIQVVETTDNGVEVWRNPVQTNSAGEIVGGSYADKVKKDNLQKWQQNTQTDSVWICVQKDASTFGTIIPNSVMGYRPNVGDTFNIINIDLPQEYVIAAERTLEEEGLRYMADNNTDKFTFSIDASRIFFAENPEILESIDAYSKLKINYDDVDYELYIDNFSIECKDGEALPNIKIGLTDTLAVGESFSAKIAEQAASLIYNPYTMYGGGGGGSGLNLAIADNRYLNKTRADRTAHRLSTDSGFEVGRFISGASGGIFYEDPETHQTWIETDMLKVRMKAIFEELMISKAQTVQGKMLVTPGGSIKISYVEELKDDTGTDVFRCYFKAEDEDDVAKCCFVESDQVICQEFNTDMDAPTTMASRFYWRVVKAVNNEGSYVDLYKEGTEFVSGTDVPKAGDVICQLGYRGTDAPYRQTAITISTVGDADAPSIKMFTDINTFALTHCIIGFGFDRTKGSAYLMAGSETDSQFLNYNQKDGLKIKGQISVDSPLSSGGTLGDALNQSGSDVYRVELSPNTMAVPFRANGTLDSSQAMPKVTVDVYSGNKKLSTSEWSFGGGTQFTGPNGAMLMNLPSDPTNVLTYLGSSDFTSNKLKDTDTVAISVNVGTLTIMSSVVVFKVRPGEGIPGESSLRLVLSRDIVALPCDENGDVIGSLSDLSEVTATLYKGTQIVTGAKYEIEKVSWCTAEPNGIVENPTFYLTKIDADTATVTIKGYEPNGTSNLGNYITATVSFCKIKQGEQGPTGPAAVVYTIEPSTSIIKKDVEGKFSPVRMTCTIYKTTGNSPRVVTSEKYLYFKRKRESSTTIQTWQRLTLTNGTSSAVTPTSSDTELIFGLFNTANASGNPLAQITVPILVDADNLEGNGENLIKNTNQGTRQWDLGAWTLNAGTTLDPVTLMSLGESEGIPPGAIMTNSYIYPYGAAGEPNKMPELVQYFMFFAVQNDFQLDMNRKYSLSFDMIVKYRGPKINIDYGFNKYSATGASRDIIGETGLLPEAAAENQTVTKTIHVSTPVTPSQIKNVSQSGDKYDLKYFSLCATLNDARTDATGLFQGQGETELKSIVVRNLKLEKGPVATAWTPAPTDVDYLMQAFRESTTITGGVVMTSRVRVGCTINGVWTEYGGLNGAVTDFSGAEYSRAPILYCGGQMIDKATEPTNTYAATAMIRQDGTAYFSNNTVRFEQEMMQVGDNVVLDSHGLHMYDSASGEEKLVIINDSVGTLDTLSSATAKQINLSASPYLYFYNPDRDTDAGLKLNPGLYLVRMTTTTTNIGTVTKGTSLNIDVSVKFSISGWNNNMQMQAKLMVRLKKGYNIIATYPLTMTNNNGSFTFATKVTATLDAGTYSLEILHLGSSAGNKDYNTQQLATATAKGSATPTSKKTKLGNDGLVSIWGNTALMVKQGEFVATVNDAKVKLKDGRVALEQGVSYVEIAGSEIHAAIDEGSADELYLRIAPDGIWIRSGLVQEGQIRRLRLDKLLSSGFFDW